METITQNQSYTKVESLKKFFGERAANRFEFVDAKLLKGVTNWAEFHSLPYFQDIWKGWQGMGSSMKVNNRFEFIKAYVQYVDPKTNYGRSYNLFKVYKDSDGQAYIGKVEVSGSLSNSALRTALLCEDGFVKTNYHANTKESRAYLMRTEQTLIVE